MALNIFFYGLAGQTVRRDGAAGDAGVVGKEVVPVAGTGGAAVGVPEALLAEGVETELTGVAGLVVVVALGVAQFVDDDIVLVNSFFVDQKSSWGGYDLSESHPFKLVNFLLICKIIGIERKYFPFVAVTIQDNKISPYFKLNVVRVEVVGFEFATAEVVLFQGANNWWIISKLQEIKDVLIGEGQLINRQHTVDVEREVLFGFDVVGKQRMLFRLTLGGNDEDGWVGLPGHISDFAIFNHVFYSCRDLMRLMGVTDKNSIVCDAERSPKRPVGRHCHFVVVVVAVWTVKKSDLLIALTAEDLCIDISWHWGVYDVCVVGGDVHEKGEEGGFVKEVVWGIGEGLPGVGPEYEGLGFENGVEDGERVVGSKCGLSQGLFIGDRFIVGVVEVDIWWTHNQEKGNEYDLN